MWKLFFSYITEALRLGGTCINLPKTQTTWEIITIYSWKLCNSAVKKNSSWFHFNLMYCPFWENICFWHKSPHNMINSLAWLTLSHCSSALCSSWCSTKWCDLCCWWLQWCWISEVLYFSCLYLVLDWFSFDLVEIQQLIKPPDISKQLVKPHAVAYGLVQI